MRVLPNDQIVVRCAMTPNPAAGGRLKAAAEIPSAEGYEIHVSCRRPAAQGARPVAARMQAPAVPFPPEGRLALSPQAQSASWHFSNADGDLVSVSVRLGARAPREDVDGVLAAVETVLLRPA